MLSFNNNNNNTHNITVNNFYFNIKDTESLNKEDIE